MAQTPNIPTKGEDIKAEDRYRYIGFEVFPSKSETFWKSESEAQKFVQQVHSGDADALLHRDFSLLETQAMGKIDRWILTITGLVLLLTVAMPWVSFRTETGSDLSLSWLGALSAVGSGVGTGFSAGIGVGLSAILSLVLLIGAPVLGVWTLAMVFRKSKTPETYQLGLRTPLKLGYVLLFSGMAIFVLSFLGGDIPGFSSWGLIDPPEHYGIGALLQILSFGPFLAMAMGMIFGVKSGDL